MRIPDIIIAIDGYSSTGKSSFAKLIAKEFGFLYLDSGALYRGVTLYAVEHSLIDSRNVIDEKALAEALPGIDLHFEDKGGCTMTYMGERCIEKEIRSLPISQKVSPVSALAVVREYVDRKLHLRSISLAEGDDPNVITDHGAIIDQDGRAARMIMSMSADDDGHVFVYGSWHVRTFKEATLQYLLFDYPNGDLYKLLKRGEFFAVIDTLNK